MKTSGILLRAYSVYKIYYFGLESLIPFFLPFPGLRHMLTFWVTDPLACLEVLVQYSADVVTHLVSWELVAIGAN